MIATATRAAASARKRATRSGSPRAKDASGITSSARRARRVAVRWHAA